MRYCGQFGILIATIMGAFYTIAGKKLLHKYPAFSLTTYAMLLGSIGLIPFIRMSFFEEIFSMSLVTWFAVIFLGLFSTVIGYSIWYMALEIKSASEVSIYLYCIPIISTITSYILFDDKLTPLFLFGGMLIISGLLIANKK